MSFKAWVDMFLIEYALLCSVLSVHLTSSKSLVGIAGVASEIQKEKKVSYFSINLCISHQ